MERAFQSGVRLLAQREHSTVELRRKLSAKGYAPNETDAVIERLTHDGLLSDRRFTENFIRSRVAHGFGPLHIQAQLRERGIDADLSAEFMDLPGRHWRELAQTARQKRFGQTQPENYRERAPQMRFLQQRGFTMEQINAVFKPEDDG